MGASRRERARAEAVERLVQSENEDSARSELPKPEFRQQVHALAESQWGEPVVAIHLGDRKPSYDVPGRRADGTIEGEQLIRRSFWNILRGAINTVFNIFTLFGAGGMGDVFERSGQVTGGENAQALGLADAVRSAETSWLVYSPSRLAIIDSGSSFSDPADSQPKFVWQGVNPGISSRRVPIEGPDNIACQLLWLPHTEFHISWPDGSAFDFHVNGHEANVLKLADS